MARILTGIQSSGRPHLGNILGAIIPAIELAHDTKNESFLFIADLHALTTVKDGANLKENTYSVAAAWLAFGLDPKKTTFYRQSDVPEVTDLYWHLSCFTPYPMLANAHSFKDKSARLADVNAGLFNYPVLMAADILLYQAKKVPIGKDQKQHIEITRDLARVFNHQYKKEVFTLPEPLIREDIMLIPGTDGQKMSKSYGNVIDLFLPEKQLRKQIMKIVTESIAVEAPKNPDTDNVFSIYKHLATPGQVQQMCENYQAGNYGFGRAKEALFELILNRFSKQRALYHQYIEDKELLDSILKEGAKKARTIAHKTSILVRECLGL